jgi:hypothetical protein
VRGKLGEGEGGELVETTSQVPPNRREPCQPVRLSQYRLPIDLLAIMFVLLRSDIGPHCRFL